ncbi:beta-galactosidase [Streptomyces sp. TLI_55]|uniref:beta-galactosidase n=1 Tax=Streptomyces sp. TLI_55 TaxID=1938861 RepID=UPI0027B90892|nr:beta-galactosidase [Streptomyces sp. TLI_55]
MAAGALSAGLLSATAPPAAAASAPAAVPRSAAATHSITYDDYSLKIDGKRLYVWSGEFHYWRLPSPQAWRDVLQKMKAGGFNAVSIYFDWAYHSPKQGVYDFSGVRDVDKLLDMAAETGIYVIARPSPYINAETDSGGLPGWLIKQQGTPRTAAPDYLSAADEWLSRIDPILARHQLTNGTGTVIAYQVENEFYNGNADGHAYMQHLVDKARADGITVPLTGNNSGVHNDLLDIDGPDSYPQGFDCSHPDTWNALPDLSWGHKAGKPLYLPEFQGGAFDPWGGPGYDKCRELTNGQWEKAAYENNIGVGATMQSFYMTYGGTSWGWLASPGNGYTSYDYGAPIKEDRELTEKYYTDKRLGYFVQSVQPLAKTDLVPDAPAPADAELSQQVRRNPDDGTTFVVVRHKDVNDTSTVQTQLNLGPDYPSVPQEPGTAVTIAGRDSKLLVADYRMDHQDLRYSTSELMTHGDYGDGVDTALFYGRHGQDGETVLHYASRPRVTVLAGSVKQTWDAARGDLRLNYTHDGLAQVLVQPADGSTPLRLLLADDATADRFWQLDTGRGPVLVRGPELVRTAAFTDDQLRLTGDTDKPSTLQVIAAPSARTVTWNGKRVSATEQQLPGPVPVALPTLTGWRTKAEAPESQYGYDDAAWQAADKNTTTNPQKPAAPPVLYTDEYGFHSGAVWYRGHFQAAGTEKSISLAAGTGNQGVYLAWLNGVFLGSSGDGAHAFTFPAGALRPGTDNVISVLVENMGHDEAWVSPYGNKNPRGLLSAYLTGSTRQLSWRIQGKLGGEDLVDPARGPYNTGGLTGERRGWYLPGYPDADWKPAALPASGSAPGITWYRTSVNLSLPKGQDVPLGIRIDDDPSRHYRALIYVNGWMVGQYVNDIGPQHSFPVQPGMLRTDGRNTIAIAVWNQDATTGGLGKVSLEEYGNHTTSLTYPPIASPTYGQVPHQEAVATADVRVSAPDVLKRGESGRVTAFYTPRRNSGTARDTTLALTLPDGWSATPDTVQHIGTVQPGSTATRTWTVTAPTGDQPGAAAFGVTATTHQNGRTGSATGSATIMVPVPPPTGSPLVSALPFTSTNGWGPVERDTSNGEDAAGDGHTITLNGTTYTKGLGAHAPSDVTVNLGGNCTAFTAVVGIDDETGGYGSVTFTVLADGKPVATTDVLRAHQDPVTLNADITGAQHLDLVVGDGGDGNGSDHADWANARLTCAN